VGFSVVIGIGLNQSNYASYIVPIVTGTGGDLAGVIPGADGVADLDRMLQFYGTIIQKAMEETAHLETILEFLMVLLKSAIVLVGLMPFIVLASVTLAIAECGIHIIAMVGPLFFGALLFPATRQYFSAWLNSALSYALLPLMVSTVSLISVGISKEALSEDGTLQNATLSSVITASVINWILVYLVKEAKSLASSLSSGGISSTTGNSTGDKAQDLMKKGGKEGAKRAGQAAQKAGQAVQNLLKNTIRKAG
jgi:type IV secretion system protein VirB6